MPTFKGDQDAILEQLRRAGLVREEAPAKPPAGAPKGRRKPRRREGGFQKAVIEYAQLKGWRVAHFRAAKVPGPNGTFRHLTPVAADGKGFPDLVLVRERVIFAELKDKGRKRKPEQIAWGKALTAANAHYFLWFPKDWPIIERVLR